MAMHPAYLTPCPPARRSHGLMAAMCAALLLLPGAGWAYGVPVGADGTPSPVSFWADSLWGGAGLVIVAWAIAGPLVLAINWGAQRGWKAAFKTPPPFGFYSLSAMVFALLLAAIGVFAVPAFSPLFASFGADLPWPAQLTLSFGYLLPGLAILVPIMFYALRNHARRERYFSAILAGEWILLALAAAALNLPIFPMGEAVS